MKTKSLLAYYVPLLILLVLMLTVQFSEPPESASVKACKHYASCVVISSNVPSWLNFR
ncbi:hypothetical protein PS723_05387 [Pseudomonas fluorescens]|uniref:Uncharacterized protein n=1 Tax=Pseudomonas fluorescens TaxID=294 RepID=A0A5E7FA15_PSEFL|nr:hypothetical protein PS723_05387 [Pseudomonas fluorescens]